MAKGFDRSRAYGEVFGNPDVKYFQNGNFYNAKYEPVTESGESIPLEQEDDGQLNLLDAVEPVVVPELPEEDDAPDDTMPDFDNMPWQKIKKMVERAGGVWTNKVEGIAYLKGLVT